MMDGPTSQRDVVVVSGMLGGTLALSAAPEGDDLLAQGKARWVSHLLAIGQGLAGGLTE